ncbi:hypothetical protein ABZ470_35510 [Streptosporangium sp. NPDC020072]|uniref:Uncharacterized protein n=1 Tax=Streptosporangium jomthongense TaxID=1193683 RepID=A0ABV8EYM9_9ACTN
MKLYRSSLRSAATAAAVAALLGSGLTTVSAIPAQAAPCTVNIYKVNTGHGGSSVYVSYMGAELVYQDPKADDSPVTGPSSYVMKPNQVNGRRAVYLAGGRLAWMYAPALEYETCR